MKTKKQSAKCQWDLFARKLAHKINYTGVNTKAHYVKLFVIWEQCTR